MYEGLNRVFPLENMFAAKQARDAGTKPAFCQLQLVSEGCPEKLRQRRVRTDWHIVL